MDGLVPGMRPRHKVEEVRLECCRNGYGKEANQEQFPCLWKKYVQTNSSAEVRVLRQALPVLKRRLLALYSRSKQLHSE